MRYFAVFYQHYTRAENGTQSFGCGYTTMHFDEFPSNAQMMEKITRPTKNAEIVLTGWTEMTKEDYLRYLGEKP